MALDHMRLQEKWLRIANDTELGLWVIVKDLVEKSPHASPSEIRSMTVNALRPILESGKLYAADLLPDGKVRLWKGSSDEILNRIDAEWIGLGRDPNIGDIVWFLSGVWVRSKSTDSSDQ